MNELTDFLNLISEAKKRSRKIGNITVETFVETVDEKPKLKIPKVDISSKLKDTSFLSLLESEMVKSKEQEKEQRVKENIFTSFFESLSAKQEPLGAEFSEVLCDNLSELYESDIVEALPENVISGIVEETIVELVEAPEIIVEAPKKLDLTDPSHYDKLFKTNTDNFAQPDAPKIDPTVKALTDKIKYMEDWLTKISMTGPGSGEVNLRYLDDVDRPSIYDGRYLRYSDSKKKFEFAEVNPHDITYTTTLVTTPTYTVDDDDYYVGVNYAGPTTITLPLTPTSGRMIIIKDESGNAETNPITVLGNVDNDAGGFIIQINNGAIQLIYRNGWRIV
jgi:hypothetical protein